MTKMNNSTHVFLPSFHVHISIDIMIRDTDFPSQLFIWISVLNRDFSASWLELPQEHRYINFNDSVTPKFWYKNTAKHK